MPPIDEVQVALSWQRLSDDWLKEGGTFVPHPATYLNARRWEDGRPTAPKRPTAPDPRCSFHRAAGNTPHKPKTGYVISCPVCKDVQSAEIASKRLSPEQQRELAQHRAQLKRGGEPQRAGNVLAVILPSAPKSQEDDDGADAGAELGRSGGRR